MKNYVQEGKSIALTAPSGGVTSGQSLLIGALPVVAHNTAPAGQEFTAFTCGVFSLATASTPTAGAAAYITAAGAIVSTASGNTLVGNFISAKDGNGDALVLFK